VPGPARPSGMADLLLGMQRSAGNQAVARLLSQRPGPGPAGPSLQRLKVTSSQLKKETTALTVRGSSFNEVHEALEDYEKADKKAVHGDRHNILWGKLLEVDRLCVEWLRSHSGSLGKQDTTRRDIILKLRAAVAEERSALMRLIESDMYIESLTNEKSSQYAGMAPVYQAKALTDATKPLVWGASAGQPRKDISDADRQKFSDLVQKKGLMGGELAAIRVFTSGGGDFNYINPAQAAPNEDKTKDWMTQNKKEKAHGQAWGKLEDKTLRGEGQWHAQMAMSGMEKLDPFDGMSFRGQTTNAFTLKAGDTYTFGTLASTSKHARVAVNFANDNLFKGSNNIAVLWSLDHKGGHRPGRDVELLSALAGEAEVMLFPGSTFEIVEVVERGVGVPTGPLGDLDKALKEAVGANINTYADKLKIYFVRAQMVPVDRKPGGAS